MRILVLGGTGFIGSGVVARLSAEGHDCVTLSRSGRSSRHIALDIATALEPSAWIAALSGVDAVVNAAGVLQQDEERSARLVAGMNALYDACEAAGVRRIIHISAIGSDDPRSDFSRAKRNSETVLTARDLDWIVLRPSLVIGRSAYGGSAMIRGLAALPVLPVMPDMATLQPLHLDDVVETVVCLLRPGAPARTTLDLVGPRPISLAETVAIVRRWLGWPPAREFGVPALLARLAYAAGDGARLLGWPTPLSSTARRELARGGSGDAEPWRQATGITPQDLETALARDPASVQERWFAQLYLLKPLIFGVFGLFWIATGLISLTSGYDTAMALLREGGLPEHFGLAALIAGALADSVIGCAIIYRPLSRYGLWAALLISVAYAVAGTVLIPRLWGDPLGPMLKIAPIVLLTLVALAIREDR